MTISNRHLIKLISRDIPCYDLFCFAENVRMGRSSGESDLNDEQDTEHVMLQPPPGKSAN